MEYNRLQKSVQQFNSVFILALLFYQSHDFNECAKGIKHSLCPCLTIAYDQSRHKYRVSVRAYALVFTVTVTFHLIHSATLQNGFNHTRHLDFATMLLICPSKMSIELLMSANNFYCLYELEKWLILKFQCHHIASVHRISIIQMLLPKHTAWQYMACLSVSAYQVIGNR